MERSAYEGALDRYRFGTRLGRDIGCRFAGHRLASDLRHHRSRPQRRRSQPQRRRSQKPRRQRRLHRPRRRPHRQKHQAPHPNPTATAASTEEPTPQPSIPTPPPGLPAGWEKQSDRVENGREAELVVRTGSIDNLGFGWPPNFTPFSGKSTPAHAWICDARPGAAPGTDRNMLGTGVTDQSKVGKSADGYSGCGKRPDNLPQAVPLEMGTLPSNIHGVFFQMFLDDFQAPAFHSHFQVSLNGTRIPQFEDTINQMDQTGPIGKLITLQLLPEYWPILKSGTVNLLIDDPTTGAPDGYAIDFVRVLVNPGPFQYSVSISCTVVDAATQKPIAKASVSAAQVTVTTAADGTCSMKGVPAGLVSVGASAVDYDSQTQLLDLAAGDHGVARFELKRHKESVEDLKQQIQQSGTVAIYGIHFDTGIRQAAPRQHDVA